MLLTGREAADHAGRVPGRPRENRPAEEADRRHHRSDDGAVREPRELLLAEAGLVRDGADDGAGPDQGRDGHHHGDYALREEGVG